MKIIFKKVISLALCLTLVFNDTMFIYADEEDMVNAATSENVLAKENEESTTISNINLFNESINNIGNNNDKNDAEETESEEDEFEETEPEDSESIKTESKETESKETESIEIESETTEVKESESKEEEFVDISSKNEDDIESKPNNENDTIIIEEQTITDIEEKNENEIYLATSSEVYGFDKVETDVDEDVDSHRVLSFRPGEFEAPKAVIDKKSSLFGDAPLPSSYDSRNFTNDYGVNIISPVKDQGNYGTCWAFAEIGMFESAIKKKNYVTNEADGDLSEAALVYFTLCNKNITNAPEYMDKPGLEGHDYTEVIDPLYNFANTGSNYVEANLVASSYIGIVKEDDETNYDKMPDIIENGIDKNYAFKKNAYNLGSAYFINKKNEELVKKAIMDYGSVAISYDEARNNSNCHNINGEWYYYHNARSANHGVLVVGWDDNIPKENFYYSPGSYAPRKGGWLVKNSWGTNSARMNEGYFWISYADTSIDETIVSIDPIKADTYKYNYHYDTTGNEVIAYYPNLRNSAPKCGNVYKVSDDEDQTLDAINLALAGSNSKYKILIYTSDTSMDNPSDGILRLSQEDTKVSSGIYTVELNNPVSLKKGTYFSIVIVPISGDGDKFEMFFEKYGRYFSRNYMNESALGQGYEDEDIGVGWTDFNISTGELAEKEGITCGYNLRIKGLTNPANKINLIANNGTGETSYQAVKFGVETILEKHPFSKEGYNFVCWRDENGNTYDDEATVVFNEELTLTAEWEPLTYNIVYNVNGGNVAHGSVKKIYNSSVTLDIPSKDYSTFINWYKEPTFENIYDGTSDLSNTQDDNINIYAKWQGDIFDVHFETYHGIINSGEFSEYEYGIETSLPTDIIPCDADRSQNKLFYGWYDNEEFTGTKITKIEINDHGTKNFYARYEVLYTITFDANGGGGNMSPQPVFACDNAILRRNSFTKSGYSFKNWLTENGVAYFDGQSIGQLYGNIVLKANWDKNKSSGGGSGGGGGGGGGGLPAQNIPNSKPSETMVSIDVKKAQVISDTNNSSWSTDANGNWHLKITDSNGQVVEPKNSWAVMNVVSYDALGQVKVVSNKYFFDENGKMLTGWLTDSIGNKYFLDNSMTNDMGKMSVGWKQIENSWYYFNADGTMLINAMTPDGYTIGSDGKWAL